MIWLTEKPNRLDWTSKLLWLSPMYDCLYLVELNPWFRKFFTGKKQGSENIHSVGMRQNSFLPALQNSPSNSIVTQK